MIVVGIGVSVGFVSIIVGEGESVIVGVNVVTDNSGVSIIDSEFMLLVKKTPKDVRVTIDNSTYINFSPNILIQQSICPTYH